MTEGKITILVVEDDVFMMELLVRALQQRGFAIVVAKSGKEAIDQFTAAQPNFILLDISLPDQTGLDALRQIRQLPNGPQTKVVALSNLTDQITMDEAKRLGVIEYLVKVHVTLPEIVEHVTRALGQ